LSPQFIVEDNIWYEKIYEITPKSTPIVKERNRFLNFLINTVNADLATTTTGKDNYLQSASPTTNAGTSGDCTIGYSSGSYRCIISFTTPDIDGTISAVDFNAYRSWTTGGGTETQIHNVTQPAWNETQSTWNVYSTGNNWSSAGGDYSGTVIDTEAIGTSLEYINWDIMGGTADNSFNISFNQTYDFIIKATTESGTKAFNINTKEAGSNRPYIDITYTLNEEATSTATSTNCDMTAGALDDDTIGTFMLYWFYVIIGFIILTLGYWIVDRFFHSLGGKKYD